MGFAPGKAVGSHIRGHYERILHPYNLFLSGDSLRVSVRQPVSRWWGCHPCRVRRLGVRVWAGHCL